MPYLVRHHKKHPTNHLKVNDKPLGNFPAESSDEHISYHLLLYCSLIVRIFPSVERIFYACSNQVIVLSTLFPG